MPRLGVTCFRLFQAQVMSTKILVINLVGLTPETLEQMPQLRAAFAARGQTTGLQPPFPAVTCTSQATLTTGANPDQHGIVSNGWYFPESSEIRFWLRSDRLVQGEKIWDAVRHRNPALRVANLFWRFATHSSCDWVVTERPTYWANGKKTPDIFTWPGELHEQLVGQLGPFPLFRFWGPATSIESTQWIADATRQLLQLADPDLTLTYLPHLDYDLQKFGPNSPQAAVAIQGVDQVATALVRQARQLGRDVMLLSEYGITNVQQPVFLNRVFRQAGLLAVQGAANGELLEAGNSRAFAACSHQVAHVYVPQPQDEKSVYKLLMATAGVDRVLDRVAQRELGLAHARSGQFVVIAKPQAWFAYPYWLDESKAPDFARCVAIHDKPGHDPAEMFLGPGGKAHVIRRVMQSKLGLRVPFDVISTDAHLIRGSHGRLPASIEQGPVMLTDWQHASAEVIPMTSVKDLIVKHLCANNPC